MKNAIIGTTMVIVAVLISMIHMSVSTRDVRQNELNRSMNYAARTTVEVANSKKGKETIDTDQELMDQFNKNLLSQITSDSEIEVQFMGVNAAQGLLDVKAISHFTYPIGSPGQVQSRKTVIIDEIKEKGILLGGESFNKKFSKEIKGKITDVKFTDVLPRELENFKFGVNKWDISSLQDKSVIAWYEGTQLFIGSVGGVRSNTNMSGMFENFTALKAVHFTNCDTENLVFMNRVFAGCTSLKTVDLGTLNTKNVVDMTGMFEGCTALTTMNFKDIETDVLATVKGLFKGCTNLESVDLSAMDTSHILNYDEMFKDCTKLQTVKQNLNLSKAVSMNSMFENCSELTDLDVSQWNMATVVSLNKTFRNCKSLTSIDISNWDVGLVENTAYMFENCTGVKELNVSKWQTGQLKNVEGMFAGCTGIQTLDVHNFKMGKIKSVKDMFKGCTSLTSINANGWDTSEIVSMESFCDGCTLLETIDITGWKADEMGDWTYAFRNCENLKSLNLSDWNTSNLKVTKGAFEGCSSLSGTMIVKNLGITDFTDMFKNTSTAAGAKFLVYDNGTTESYDFVEDIVASKQNPSANVIHVSFNAQMVDANTFHTMLGDLTKTIETIEFSNEVPDLTNYQDGINKWDFSAKQDSSIVGWYEGNVLHIAGLNGVRANDKGGGVFANFTALKNVNFNNSYVTSNVTDFSSFFEGCTSLEIIDLSGLDTSRGTNFKNMFYMCQSLKAIQIPIDTVNALSMENMFRGCASLEELNLNSFNTSKVTTMREMFRDCNNLKLLNIQSFDTSKVTNMDGMFYQCQNLTRISLNWRTENVTSMRWMFYNCMNLFDVDTTMWNTSKVTAMSHLFDNCNCLQTVNISNWNTSKVTDMSSMFKNCFNLETLDMRSIEWNSVTNTSSMFEKCEKLNGKVLINRTAWENADKMFLNAASSTEKAIYVYCSNEATRDFAKALVATKGAETNKVYFVDFMTQLVSGTHFNNMLSAEKENIQTVEFIDNVPDLSNYTFGLDKWDVSIEQDASAIAWMDGSTLFIGSLTEMVSNEDLSNMFKGFTNLTSVTISNLLNTTNVTNMAEMFADCTQLTAIDTASFNTKNVTNMAGLFKNCFMLPKLDITSWSTAKVTDMSSLFENCTKLSSLDLRNFSTSSATSLSNMFKGSSSLQTLDCSRFNTKNVTSIQSMFEGCTGLTSVNVKNWDTSKVTEMTAVFAGCSNLASVDVSHFNVGNVFSTYRMFEGCTHLQYLNLSKWDLQNVQTMNSMFKNCSNLSAYIRITESMTPDYKDIFKNAATNPARRIFILDDQTTAGAELATCMEVSKDNADSQVYHLKQNAKVKPGQEFSSIVRSHKEIKNIVFTDELPSLVDASGNVEDMVENGNIFDFAVSELDDSHPGPEIGEGGIPVQRPEKYYNYSVLGWVDGDTLKIYSNGKAFANEDSSEMFWLNMLSIDFNRRLDTSKATTMRGFFGGNSQLKSLDLSGFDTSNVTDMSNMFMKNLSLESLNVSSFNTSKVNNMNGMFSDCSKLKTLDLSSFNTSNVTNTSGMFAADSSLTSIKGLENFDMRNVTNSSYMFSNVSSLQNARIDVTNPNSDVNRMFTNASTVPNSLFLVGYGDGSRDKAKEAVATKGTNTSNVHLIDYIVEFNPNGGSVNTNSVKIDYSKPLGTLPTPTRAGYRFKGWSKTQNGTEMVQPTDVLNEDCTLYAQWQALEITLVEGTLFNSAIKAQNPNVTHIEFTTTAVPQDQIANATVVSVAGGGMAYMYTVDGVTYISPEEDGIKIKANTDCSEMFRHLQDVENIQFNNFDTSQVTKMSMMFYSAGQNATTWTIGGLSQWNTSQVTDMSTMFYQAGENSTTWNLDIHNWDTSQVTRMGRMFYGAGMYAETWHLNANNLNTSQVTDMREMFTYAGQSATDWSIGDIGNWNTSKVTNMYRMFYCAAQNATTFNLDIHNWDVSQVVDMKEMFNRAGGNADTWNLNASNWNTSKVTSMYYMFEFAGQNSITFNLNVSNWNIGQANTNMEGMFYCTGQQADPFTLDLANWDVTNVASMSEMFKGIGANKILTPRNISKDVDITNITDKVWYDETEKYKEYPDGTFPVGNGNVSHTLVDEKPKQLTYGLVDGPTFNTKLSEINSKNPIQSIEFVDSNKPSSGVTEITGIDADSDGGVVGWYTVESDNTSKVYISTQNVGQKVIADTNCSSMFLNFGGLKNLVLTNLDTSKTVNMNKMFAGVVVKTLDLSMLNVSNVANMSEMFFSSSMENLNIQNWKTSSLSNVNTMFQACRILVVQGIETLDVRNVDTLGATFYEAQFPKMDVLDLSQWAEGKKAGDWLFGNIKVPKIKLPKNLQDIGGEGVTSQTWYDETDGYKAYPTDTLPYGQPVSHTLVDTPRLKGTLNVVSSNKGMQLSANVKNAPTNAKIAYQWYRIVNNKEEIVSGATKTTYDVSKDDTAEYICKVYDSLGTYDGEIISNRIAKLTGSLNINESKGALLSSANGVQKDATLLTSWFKTGTRTETTYATLTGASTSNDYTWDVIPDSPGTLTVTTSFLGSGSMLELNLIEMGTSKVIDSKRVTESSDRTQVFNLPEGRQYRLMMRYYSQWDSSDRINVDCKMTCQSMEEVHKGTTLPADMIQSNVKYESRAYDESGNYYGTIQSGLKGKLYGELYLNDKTADKNYIDAEFKKAPADAKAGYRWYVSDSENGPWELIPNETGMSIAKKNYGNRWLKVEVYDKNNIYFGDINRSIFVEKQITYGLVDGNTFNKKIKDIVEKSENGLILKSIEFVDTPMPSSGVTEIIGLDADGDGGVVGWYVNPQSIIGDEDAKVYISTQKQSQKVVANADCSEMFYMFDEIENIDFTNFDTSQVTNMSAMFCYTGFNATTFSLLGLDNWNTSQVTDMHNMFSWAGQKASTWSVGDISQWNTSKVKDMSNMFASVGENSTSLNLDLSKWNTSKVTDMHNMFSNTGYMAKTWSVGNLSNWNTSQVTDMSNMFANVAQKAYMFDIGDLRNWDTSKVSNMSHMFESAGKNATDWYIGNLSQWNTSQVTDMSYMFDSAGGNTTKWALDLSGWNTSNVTNMQGMFTNSTSLVKLDISGFNISNVTNMSQMFSGCSSLRVLHYKFAQPNANVNITNMFLQASTANGASLAIYDDGSKEGYDFVEKIISTKSSNSQISHGGVLKTGQEMLNILDPYMSKAEKIVFSTNTPSGMPGNSGTDISRDKNRTVRMKYDETNKVLHIYNESGYSVMANPDSSMMFMTMPMAATVKEIDFNNAFHTGAVTDMNSFFGNQKMLEKVNLAGIDTSNVTNMSNMFSGCENLKSVDVSGFNTSKVTSMTSMFKDCKALNKLDVSSFNTSNVTAMNYMFSGLKLPLLDLRNFDTNKVTNTAFMFSNSDELVEVYVSDTWNVANVTISNGMFQNCEMLKGAEAYNKNYTDKEKANWTNGYLKYGEKNKPIMLTFTLGHQAGSRYNYNVPLGMTWKDFIESEYYKNSQNPIKLSISDSVNRVYGDNGLIEYYSRGSMGVASDEQIVSWNYIINSSSN